MILSLDILDKNGVLLDVANINVGSSVISLTDAITDSISGLTLQTGNDYNIVFPADALAGASTVTITADGGSAINITTAANELFNGVTVPITADVDITEIFLSVLSVGATTYDATVTVNGEDIDIILSDGITTWNFSGVNEISQTIPDNSNVTIQIDSPTYFSYSNAINVYNEDVDASVKLIEDITDPLDPDFRFPYPWFFTILEPCTYRVHVYNAQSAPFGRISYDESGTVFSDGSTNAIYDPCGIGSFNITQTIDVREVPNCGGTSPILYTETYTINSITVIEYVPSLILNDVLGCCQVLDEVKIIYPSELNLYFVAPTDFCTDMELIYTLTGPDGVITTTTYDHTALTTYSDLDELFFTFTPTVLGTYGLVVSLQNCCATTVSTIPFDSCLSWIMSGDCAEGAGSCNGINNVINITNLSSINSISYTLRELNPDTGQLESVTVEGVEQTAISLVALQSVELNLVTDGVYTVSIDGEPDEVFVLDCNIRACKKKLLQSFLCQNDPCNPANQEMLSLWIRFSAYEEVLYAKWDEWRLQRSLYSTLNVNDILEDVAFAAEIVEALNKICCECGITNDCDASNRTCAYTVTNFGYLVPTRCYNIIVPKTNNNCDSC